LILLLVGGGVGLVLLLAVGAVGLYFLLRPKPEGTPKSEQVAYVPPRPETKKDTPLPTQPKPPPTEAAKPAPPPPQTKPPETKPPEPKQPPKVAKLPVPDEAAQARAEKDLKDKYKEDYAKNKPEDKLALAAKFLQPGRENRNDPADWFVILREARDLSVEAQRPRLAVEAINEIDKWFLVNAHEMKIEVLTKLSQSTSDAVVQAAGLTALSQVKPALDDDNYDAALRLVTFADDTVRKTAGDAGKPKPEDKARPNEENKPKDKLLALIADRKADVQAFQKDYQAVAAAKDKLKDAPDDPDANLAVGRYLCFFHGRYEEGLPLLAKGSDDILKDTAKKDLAQPADVTAQTAVGDLWWDLGFNKNDRLKMHVHERALYWYEPAEAKATGQAKTKLTDRIKKIREQAAKHVPRLTPGSFYGRGIEDRVLLLRDGGGTMQSEEAVERGLEWLSHHQALNGGWSTDTFPLHGKCDCGDVGEKHDIAATAFGLLPFLGAGEVYPNSRFQKTVQRGLEFLLRQQKEKGNFSDNAYENALATIAICEAYGLTGDNRLKGPAQSAANFIVGAQFTDGSWGYSAGTKGDLSVTGWQFSALKTAYYAKLRVPDATFAQVTKFLEAVADPSGLGYGYNTPGAGRATSAVGFLCREYLGWTSRRPELAKGVDNLAKPENFVTREAPAMYYLFYATHVMHHFGGKNWQTWNPKARDLLLELQDRGTDHSHQKGSWFSPNDDHAKTGGRLMSTSLAILTLEVYYYSVPLNDYGPAVLLDY
jgi:hypothetical protein